MTVPCKVRLGMRGGGRCSSSQGFNFITIASSMATQSGCQPSRSYGDCTTLSLHALTHPNLGSPHAAIYIKAPEL